jgi:carbon-monoxide dehydrogenase medium subunit
VKPAAFEYVPVETIEAALQAKSEHGEQARFLAGGQSLVPAMNFRMAEPAVLIDLNPIAGLDYIRHDGSALRIGALARYRALQRSDLVARHQPMMAQALPHVAHPQIRNRGTLAGNLAHADPASEMPAVVLALGGRLLARSVRGERWIAAQDFFQGVLVTALEPDELLAEIEVPDLPPGARTCFLEVARRQGDYALLGVAAAAAPGAAVRLAFCSAGDTPVLLTFPDHASPDEVARMVQRDLDPPGNLHATGAYRRHLAGVLARRALQTIASPAA